MVVKTNTTERVGPLNDMYLKMSYVGQYITGSFFLKLSKYVVSVVNLRRAWVFAFHPSKGTGAQHTFMCNEPKIWKIQYTRRVMKNFGIVQFILLSF